MAESSLLNIYKTGKELGFTGDELDKFVKSVQADERATRAEKQDDEAEMLRKKEEFSLQRTLLQEKHDHEDKLEKKEI